MAILVISTPVHAASLKTQNVFLIISDGLRWQEIFNGAEEKLLTQNHGGVKNVAALRAEFWRDTPEAYSEGDWIAVMGPDTPPLGERTQTQAHTQSQIAATIAALLGKDYRAFFPAAGAPITDILGAERK